MVSGDATGRCGLALYTGPTMKAIAVCVFVSAVYAQSPADLIEAARKGPASAELKERVSKMSGAPTRVTVWGQDYLFLANSPSAATVAIDQQPPTPMTQVEGTSFSMLLVKMRTGVTHQYQFYAAGKPL